MSDRYWIVNPITHRAEHNRLYAHRDGETVDTAFGKAVMIVSSPPDDLWICDFCNAETDPTIPIACEGSYALCPECTLSVHAPPAEQFAFPDPRWWADKICGCNACALQMQRWTEEVYRAMQV